MNTLLHITANIKHPVLLQYKVEKLAGGGLSAPPTISDTGRWQADDTRSVEAFVEGGLSFKCGGQSLQMPFAAPFLFTCTAGKESGPKLTWSQSLS